MERRAEPRVPRVAAALSALLRTSTTLEPHVPLLSHLAEQAVVFAADGAVEGVDRVLVNAPAGAVGRGAVVAALAARLGHREAALQPPLVLLRRHQLRSTRHAGSMASEGRVRITRARIRLLSRCDVSTS